MSDFGELLKRLRQGANFTQEQLGDKLHLSKTMVSYYERSWRYPSADILLQVADVFHVSVDFLLGREKKKQTIDLSGLPDKDIEFVRDVVQFLRGKNDEQEQKPKEKQSQKKKEIQNRKDKEPKQKKDEEQDKDTTANC